MKTLSWQLGTFFSINNEDVSEGDFPGHKLRTIEDRFLSRRRFIVNSNEFGKIRQHKTIQWKERIEVKERSLPIKNDKSIKEEMKTSSPQFEEEVLSQLLCFAPINGNIQSDYRSRLIQNDKSREEEMKTSSPQCEKEIHLSFYVVRCFLTYEIK